jgi:glutaredoxin
MKTKVIFYHAGCPVCLSAEQNIVSAIDGSRYDLEIVHLGDCLRHSRAERKEKISAAKASGVESVPALVIDNKPFHINFGANIADLG